MSKKLGISSNYLNRDISKNDVKWIRVLCENVLSSHKLYVSEIFVDSYPRHIQIKCLLFFPRNIYTMKKARVVLLSLLSLLRSIICLKSNKNVSFKCGILPNVVGSSRVLGTYLKRRIGNNPMRLSMYINKVLKRMLVRLTPYKLGYVSSGNKFKSSR